MTGPPGGRSAWASTPTASRGRPCASSSWARGPGRSSPCGRPPGTPSAGTSAAGARSTPRLPAESAPDRYHYNPHDPTPAVGGPALNMGTAGRKEQRRREHRHDVLTYTSPVLTDDLTVIGPLDRDALPPLVAGAHRLLRAPVRRQREGEVVQPQRRHRPPAPGLGAAPTTRRVPARDPDVADGEHLPHRAPHPPPGLEWRPPALSPATPARVSRWARGHPALGRPGGVPRRGSAPPPSRCPSCPLIGEQPLSPRHGSEVGPVQPLD